MVNILSGRALGQSVVLASFIAGSAAFDHRRQRGRMPGRTNESRHPGARHARR